MITSCGKIKLKPDSIDKVYEWAKELNSRSQEALATLRDEGVYVESVFLDRTEHGDYLIYFMKYKDQNELDRAYVKSEHEIDKYHRAFKKATWESAKDLELILDFENF